MTPFTVHLDNRVLQHPHTESDHPTKPNNKTEDCEEESTEVVAPSPETNIDVLQNSRVHNAEHHPIQGEGDHVPPA